MKARKRFGQHFLADPEVLQRITDSVAVRSGDRLLEIGPGRGALTEHLDGLPDRYVAVELDRDLVGPLQERFPGIDVVSADILSVPLQSMLEGGDWRVVGNLPYNITTPLLVRLLDVLPKLRDMHFMVQREVALRLAALPGSKAWGRLTVMMQYHCEVTVLFEVAPESFVPAPKVHSALVRLTPRTPDQRVKDLAVLDLVLRTAFSKRRKRLSNALESLQLDWDRVDVDPGLRPDQLRVVDYVHLADVLSDREL